MATVVLSVAGAFFGGPIGAAIGGVAGAAFDREVLFKPAGRQGPRLQELRVQTSSYGTQIPKLFGTMRVAGSVIWATDLIESRVTEGGKGRPDMTRYSYSASFAVALSARPILAVRRIWADGKLLRGAAGDLKSEGGFRLHLGGEDQAPDPLIAAAEGAGLAPAHRGIAYAVFEDLALAEYGNRIPSLSFEVVADAGPVEAGAIFAGLSEGEIAAEPSVALTGFAASGASVRVVGETLAGAAGGWFEADGDTLVLRSGAGAAVPLADAGTATPGKKGARGVRAIGSGEAVPGVLTLTYYDPARDYQAGVQRAARPGGGGREARMELAAAIDASAAKALAGAALARAGLERRRRTLALPWTALAVQPGARVQIAGEEGLWRVERWMLEAMVLTLECVPAAPPPPVQAASPGRMLGAPDLRLGRTVVHAFELPLIGDALPHVPQLAIAAAGTEPGWRGAALLWSGDGGASWTSAGASARPAVLGRVVTPPGVGPAGFEDGRSVLVVELAHGDMMLGDADAAALHAGTNLAMVGDELLQFGRAVRLGERRWRLSRLWRGRRGTEAAIGGQAAGDRFVLVTRDTLAFAELPLGLSEVRVLAKGAGDPAEVEAQARVAGAALVPPPPVHLRSAWAADGTLAVTWVRRSRSGWDWIDGVDAPLGEEAERYRVTVQRPAGPPRVLEVAEPRLVLAAEDAPGAVVRVQQVGARGLSRAAELRVRQGEEA
ncbi:phage tail protein [Sphingomonas sp. IC-56]|uniref:GTA baseplate fiber-binding domain-containing protein n=1 Tax=Sphingomonas sp. IC-56 TaxID=2898529 RepID=UPI001E5E28B1|nr:phage tail protein [Sphingomonas sp. IC-56]MCD2325115.1 phage tail protein [Sphingomonas sp. IC-56]